MSYIQLSVLLLLLLTILCLLTALGLTATINCATSLDENAQVVLNSRDSHVVDNTNVTTSVLLEGWSLFDIDRFNYSTISFNVTFTDMFSWGQNTGVGSCSPIFSICNPFDLMDPTLQGEDNWVVSSFFSTDGESIHVQLTCGNPGATVPSNLECRTATSVMYYETDALAPIQIDTLSYFTPAIVESSASGIISASFTKSKLGFYLAFNNSGLCTNILETLITYFQCSATNGYNNIGSLPNTSAPNVTHQPLQIQFTCPTTASSTGLTAECYANGSWVILDSIACGCNAGYRVVSQSSAYSCEACPSDTYKQSIGNTNCTVCPANSNTNEVTGETGCVCIDGFFRGVGESVVMSCGTSPSAPRNLTVERVSSNSTELTLRWDEPSSLGGRDISLLAYEVSYSKTSSPTNLTVLNQTSNSKFVFMNGFLTASTEYFLTVTSLNNLNSVSNVTNNNSITVLSSSPIVSSIMYSPQESLLYFAYRLDRAGDYIIQLTYSTLSNSANIMLNVSFSSNCSCSTIESCSCTLYNVSNLNYSLPITIQFLISSIVVVNITPNVTDTITPSTTATITPSTTATITTTTATITTTTATITTTTTATITTTISATATITAANNSTTAATNSATASSTIPTTGFNPIATNSSLNQILFYYAIPAISLAFILFCIFIIVAILLCCFCLCRMKRNSRFKNSSRFTLSENLSMEQIEKQEKIYQDPITIYDDLNAAVRALTKEIDPDNITIGEVIGNGEFGDVCRGVLNRNGRNISVALKTLKPSAQEKSKQDFFREASIMGQFSNANVIFLYGVTLNKPIMIVTPFMDNGSLDVYLKNNINQLNTIELGEICLGVASGMKYLSRIGFVHRDLAARNILLDSDMTPKITDFGLSREMEEDFYNVQTGGKIAVRWTAPEAIAYRKFNSTSDVWSFGILLWEVMSFGAIPFGEMDNYTILEQIIEGYRLPIPEMCPVSVYNMMLNCWKENQRERPTFFELEEHLGNLIRTNFGLKRSRKSARFSNSVESPLNFISIEQWLSSLNSEKYLDNFRSYGYTNMTSVWHMTEYDLLSMQIIKQSDRSRIMESIHKANNVLSRTYSIRV